MPSMDVQTKDQGRVKKRRVFYTGAGALDKGVCVCYDRDRGTAANKDLTRDNYVENPSSTNNFHFAGVTSQAYNAKTDGQWIEIYEPGSVCQVAIGVDTTVDSTIMTGSASVGDVGRFGKPGFIGRGTALALQTNASGVLYEQSDGGTDALDSTGKILTVASTTGLAVGDRLYVLAGEDDATNSVTPLAYQLITALSATTITVANAWSDGGTMEPTYYAASGNQLCWAYLFDGEESGLQEWVTPANGAVTPMTGGVTYLHGGFTPSADSTYTLADGTRYGEKKGFVLKGALATNDFLMTVTNGFKMDGASLATIELDAAEDSAYLVWGQKNWRSIETDGTEA